MKEIILKYYLGNLEIPPIIDLLEWDEKRLVLKDSIEHDFMVIQLICDYLFNNIIYNK